MGKQPDQRIVFKRNGKILDLGCGDGGLTEQLAQLVPGGTVLGIDASAGMIAAAGFSAYRITEVNRDRYFANADEMIRWIDQPSIVPFIRLLPDEKKVEFREEVIRSMLARTLQADGTCFETFRRIHVNAVK